MSTRVGLFKVPQIDFQDVIYYSAQNLKKKNLDEVDPELLRTFEKLGISLTEQKTIKCCN
jgi:Fe-S cluster assembly protein SufB